MLIIWSVDDELLARRRLGKTKLAVKPGQIGTSNATQPQNLGPFGEFPGDARREARFLTIEEYAHLRAPLPADLQGSEIFATQTNQPHPETYFLMRRSSDGFCSATGMFKIAFPWAQQAEEKAEREYLKSLTTTSTDEVAGNVWIEAKAALELAEEYGMYDWVRALLDNTEIVQSPTSAKKHITAPPKFEISLNAKVKLPPPGKATGRGSTRLRSASPSKIASPSKTKASPKKRQTKAMKEAALANANAASASLQSALDDAASHAGRQSTSSMVESQDQETPATSPSVGDSTSGNIKVDIDQEVEHRGDTEVTHTNVTIELPKGATNPAAPTDVEGALEASKAIVEKLVQLESAPATAGTVTKSRKRKFDDVEASDLDKELPVQASKRARVLEEGLKREKVRNRALLGVAGALTVA